MGLWHFPHKTRSWLLVAKRCSTVSQSRALALGVLLVFHPIAALIEAHFIFSASPSLIRPWLGGWNEGRQQEWIPPLWRGASWDEVSFVCPWREFASILKNTSLLLDQTRLQLKYSYCSCVCFSWSNSNSAFSPTPVIKSLLMHHV